MVRNGFCPSTFPRSSSREVRIRVPAFCSIFSSFFCRLFYVVRNGFRHPRSSSFFLSPGDGNDASLSPEERRQRALEAGGGFPQPGGCPERTPFWLRKTWTTQIGRSFCLFGKRRLFAVGGRRGLSAESSAAGGSRNGHSAEIRLSVWTKISSTFGWATSPLFPIFSGKPARRREHLGNLQCCWMMFWVVRILGSVHFGTKGCEGMVESIAGI